MEGKKVRTKKKIKVCTGKQEVLDENGYIEYTIEAIKPLGKGTFSQVDLFKLQYVDDTIRYAALKRPNDTHLNFTKEALFQHTLHNDLKIYGLSFCVAEVYDIIQLESGVICFFMEAFTPKFLDEWLKEKLLQHNDNRYIVTQLLLQIALILEILEEKFNVDHRDLKTNNMFVLDEEVKIEIVWKGKQRTLVFPFRIVFIDFGHACQGTEVMDEYSKLPALDPCPKRGRDFYHILACIWNKPFLRNCLETFWGNWIRERLESSTPKQKLQKIETSKDLAWLMDLTDLCQFIAPLCAPSRVISDCLTLLDEYESS
jgi:serine/threonine protein kinase